MRSYKIVFMVVVLIACLNQMASDIYTPSLPAIAHFFNASVNYAQATLAIYMFGVATSLFVYGPLSDALGRKQPLIAGIVIFIVATVVCMFSANIYILLFGRLLQGIGAGAGAGLWRSIFRDSFSGDQLAKFTSYFTLIITAIVPLSPSVGGYLEHYANWQASFVVMLLYALFTLYIVIYKFKESSKHHHMERLKPSFIAKSYKELLSHKEFLGYSIAVFFTFGGVFAWISISPILLIKYLHFSPVTYGWISALMGLIGLGLGSILNTRLLGRFGPRNLMQFGWATMLAMAIVLLIVKYTIGVNAVAIIAAATVVFTVSMFIWPNAFAGAMHPFGHIAGYAGTTYSAIQLAGGALFGAIAAHLPDATQIPYAILLLISSACAWLVYRFFVK